jgi:hypothetical protein
MTHHTRGRSQWNETQTHRVARCAAVTIAAIAIAAGSAYAQAQAPAQTGTLEIYGFGQADAIVDFSRTTRLVRRQSADQAAVVRGRVRQERPLLPEPATEPLRREGQPADGQRQRHRHVRIRHVRRRSATPA